ncbi:NAD(P)/FAD-dependent oxidoreductase [Haloferax mediterranei ATCC 33500]|uniref:Pyridine nucleotide-disulfide oxidoreductase n=1 Tax=Haloferax mediterranei (strain ATCC 33500 / DSM 1411 / JCM 8866 / NBRC 14739 / NCIMB 2177 / R-4) TaxID=523841 RepID=I3R0U9_HALMT|nr:FAD/NAD(P)-binding oxidoreductase [Haloferax mediterranei]AFK17859.1 FAD-dependent pyridine nucleotide-disulfide oxidoreductase [Haloferax mediterranei ATCC 33500]AHZ22719.1 pyridine nucleotide-disulfide oxidoreductase [Haloferax mediterranei ATCC 33500]EMA02868.1 FAD-dependent pyridine nucleotide-disulfide oxidoreductase [Haloferax mediterranei ATCC 33500]MDX5987947.1 FAD/NAD(P)-binding oxidoreductase [Haloferax mediterranei ATCC 33500]QCQ74417.1 NAD(P)/FAD-dependent oxidoreductase [Halofe
MTKRIVVVGGGTGGTVVSNRLAEELAAEVDTGDVELVLVTDDTKHVYKPVFLYVPFGLAEPEDGVRDLRELVDERVNIVINRVRRVDTEEKRLYCQDGDEVIDYDTLVLSTGAKLDPDAVPGFKEGAHHFYSAAGAEQLREALAEFDGGRLVLSVVGTPHMCPAAPLEFTFIVEDWLRDQGLHEDTELVYTYPIERSHGKPEVAAWADPILAERGVRVETDFVVDAIDPNDRAVHAENGGEVEYDLLVGIPPHRGDDLILESGLGDNGWVEVNQRTLEATDAADVYAIGDTASLPVPKAGSAAHFQAFAVADRIASKVRNHTPTKKYDGKTVCFVETGLDEASFVSFDYETPATMRRPSKTIHWAKHAYNESYWLTARGML